MDKKTFENYKQDNQVIKFGEWHGGHFLHRDTQTIVFFAFFHKGFPFVKHGEPNKRVLLKAFDSKNYQGPLPLPEIKSEQFILVNADHPDFAILFKIIIDETNAIVKLTLLRYPELGDSIITDDERTGIELRLGEKHD